MTVSLFLHAAVLVLLAGSGRVQERITRVEVGLVSLPPRISGERGAPEAQTRGAPNPGAEEPVQDLTPAPPAGAVKVNPDATPPSVSAKPRPEKRDRDSAQGAVGRSVLLSGREPAAAEEQHKVESPASAEREIESSASSAGASLSPEPASDQGSEEESAVPFEGGRASTSVPRLDAIPRYDRNAPPLYPRLARERGWEGEVLLRVLVSEGGDVRRVSVERSSNHDILDAAALRAVRRWRFHPSRLEGNPVEGEVFVPLRFKLGDF